MIRFFSTIAAVAMLAAAARAEPAQYGDTYRVTIHIADLDLGSRAGQATFHGRIHRAADFACGSVPALPLSQVQAVADCRVAFARRAQARVEIARRSADTGVAGTR
ncbi:MAG: hypothetical protein QOH81_1407 [Sphingomonadales bacterium]|jgi:UrcA family protein|nr:hypothetical protein [Sphingomonadales bacterium]